MADDLGNAACPRSTAGQGRTLSKRECDREALSPSAFLHAPRSRLVAAVPRSRFAGRDRRSWGGPPAPTVLPLVTSGQVRDANGNGAARVIRIFLYNLLRHRGRRAFHRHAIHIL